MQLKQRHIFLFQDTQKLTIIPTYTNTSRQKKTDII